MLYVIFKFSLQALQTVVKYATDIALLTEDIKSRDDDPDMYDSVLQKMKDVVTFEIALAKVCSHNSRSKIAFLLKLSKMRI